MVGDYEALTIPGLSQATFVGQGGSGKVYRAFQADLDRWVAVKVIPTFGDTAIQARFERERKALGRLSDVDGIITVHEAGVDANGDVYLIMPFVEGGSLKDLLEQHGSIGWERASTIIEQVAAATQQAHDAGVVHRDLKPGNILLTADDKPLISDFGIARLGLETVSSTSSSLTLTPAFSPPEAFESSETSEASDVYSMAATLWALIAGRPPFTAEDEDTSLTQLVGRVLSQKPGDLRTRAPGPVCAAIEAAMARAPEARPPSAAAFGEMLADARARNVDFIAPNPGAPVLGWRPMVGTTAADLTITDGDAAKLAVAAAGGAVAAGGAGAGGTGANVAGVPLDGPAGQGASKRKFAIAGAVAAAVLAIVAGAIALSGGGGDDAKLATGAQDSASEQDRPVDATPTPTTASTPTQAPTPTTPPALLADGEAIVKPPVPPSPTAVPPTPTAAPPRPTPTPTATRSPTATPTRRPPPRPVARFSSSANTTRVGVPLTFTDASTARKPATLVWTWGNGNSSNGKAGGSVNYPWSAPGTYTVTLTVSNAGGSHTASSSVQVLPPLPTASIGGPNTIAVGQQFNWPVTSANAVSGTWSSNCGVQNANWQPGHSWAGSYNQARSCSLTLTVVNSIGESASTTKNFQVVG